MPKKNPENLKPCPFCGSNSHLTLQDTPVPMPYYVKCMSCGCCTPHCKLISVAKAIWNRRAE